MNTGSLNFDRLWSLLPALHRVRDADRGELRDLVSLFAEQLAALEEGTAQLYDDLFIETCADWVAPYLGDLIGYRTLHGVVPAVASPRADVANTIAYRRRKGTATMLEQMARDVTGWPAHAVEFFEQLATTQYMNHLRLHAPATADLRDTAALLALRSSGGAYNRLAHSAEMRRPEPAHGRYNIPHVGLFLWRIEPLPITRVPLVPHPGDASGRRWRVNPLGADLALYRRPVIESSIDVLASPVHVPEALGVRALALQLRAAQRADDAAAAYDWGDGRSVVLYDGSGAPFPLNGTPPAPGDPPPPLVRVCDLRDDPAVPGAWAHEADLGADEIGLDPERGRVLLGAHRAAEHAAAPFGASFHLGQMRRIGGGEYERIPDGQTLAVQRSVAAGAAWQPALDDIAAGGRLLLQDSLTYVQAPTLRVDGVTAPGAAGHVVVVAARNGARPLLAASAATLTLDIGARGTLVLEGLVISGATLRLPAAADGEPRTLVLRDCTLVPGGTLNPDGTPAQPGALSLEIAHPFARVTIERSIVGSLRSHADAVLRIEGSAVDATEPTLVACEGLAGGEPGAELTLRDTTVVGLVHTRLLTLASNTIFEARLGPATPAGWSAPLRVQRRQQGCVRFSWLPAGAVSPRRHRCVSDEDDAALRPQFTSRRYGDAAYLQLSAATPRAIRQGADDDGEIGLMHPLAQPQREANLRIRLAEYLRYGLAAGLFYAT